MHPHAKLLEAFYTGFAARDHAAMAACYHDRIVFNDPVFPHLEGPRAGAMWRMLCERGKDLELVFSGIEADDARGKAHWEADYTFAATGRKVHNVIDATFRFEDGKIIEHTDVFDFDAWAKMAIGTPALLLGWTGLIQRGVRSSAGKQLDRFMAKRGIG